MGTPTPAIPEASVLKSFGGFATATGKRIAPPSSDAMKKAAKLINDDSKELDAKEPDPIKPSMGGFATAKGSKMKAPSEQALKRAAKLLCEGDNGELPEKAADSRSFESPAVGFQTAKGQKLKPPSESAIEKAKKMLTSESALEKFSTAPSIPSFMDSSPPTANPLSFAETNENNPFVSGKGP